MFVHHVDLIMCLRRRELWNADSDDYLASPTEDWIYVDDPPVTANKSLTATKNILLTDSAPGVLANGTDWSEPIASGELTCVATP